MLKLNIEIIDSDAINVIFANAKPRSYLISEYAPISRKLTLEPNEEEFNKKRILQLTVKLSNGELKKYFGQENIILSSLLKCRLKDESLKPLFVGSTHNILSNALILKDERLAKLATESYSHVSVTQPVSGDYIGFSNYIANDILLNDMKLQEDTPYIFMRNPQTPKYLKLVILFPKKSSPDYYLLPNSSKINLDNLEKVNFMINEIKLIINNFIELKISNQPSIPNTLPEDLFKILKNPGLANQPSLEQQNPLPMQSNNITDKPVSASKELSKVNLTYDFDLANHLPSSFKQNHKILEKDENKIERLTIYNLIEKALDEANIKKIDLLQGKNETALRDLPILFQMLPEDLAGGFYLSLMPKIKQFALKLLSDQLNSPIGKPDSFFQKIKLLLGSQVDADTEQESLLNTREQYFEITSTPFKNKFNIIFVLLFLLDMLKKPATTQKLEEDLIAIELKMIDDLKKVTLTPEKVNFIQKSIISNSSILETPSPTQIKSSHSRSRLEHQITGKISFKITLLTVCSMLGDHETVKKLLNKGLNPSYGQYFTGQPLTLAAENGHLEVVKLLAEAYRNNNASHEIEMGYYQITPLHYAAKNGHLEIVKYLVDECNVNINCFDEHGRSPIFMATLQNRLDVIKWLEQKLNARPNIPYYEPLYRDKNSVSCMHIASMYGYCNLMEHLLNQGADINCKTKEGNTPLYIAIKYKKINSFDFLLSHKASTDVRNNNGDTLLHEAARQNSTDIIDKLLNYNLDISEQNNKGIAVIELAYDSDEALNKFEAFATEKNLPQTLTLISDLRLLKKLKKSVTDNNSMSAFRQLKAIIEKYHLKGWEKFIEGVHEQGAQIKQEIVGGGVLFKNSNTL